MFDLLVNAEGGLTTAGYVVTISVGIVLFLAAVFFAGKRSKRQKMTTKQLVFCAAAMALAFVTSLTVSIITSLTKNVKKFEQSSCPAFYMGIAVPPSVLLRYFF